eukprot:s250_g13.t2
MPIHQDARRKSTGEVDRWGYDVISFMAVDSLYGTLEDLVRFVQKAHALGMAVFVDFVCNHMMWGAPHLYGPQLFLTEETVWGPRPDFSKPQVQRYILAAAELLLERIGVDGLRVDSTKSIRKFPSGRGTRLVIFVGGLPRDATEEAIAAHFSQWGTVQKVDMKYDQTTYQFRGFAFVTLGSAAEAQAPSSAPFAIFNNYDNNVYNGKWIDCKPAALGKMGDPMAMSVPPTIPTDKVAPPPTGSTLRARGLPFSATRDQVLEFFGGYGVTGRVHMKQDYMGRPSGEVFVEFISTEEALRAFNDRNFQMMGTRYVELIGASDADVKLYLDNGGKGATAGYGPMKGKGGKGPSPYDFMAFFGGY